MISLALAPLPDGATLASFADVTDRFRIETASRERNEALEAADRLKTEFVKRVSYEFRTPLNSILGFAEMLKAGTPGPLNAKQREYMDAVVGASNALRDLINDILDLSQIEAGAMELDLGKRSTFSRCCRAWPSARANGRRRRGIALELDCREDAGAVRGRSRGGCGRCCSTCCPTRSNTRRAAAPSRSAGEIKGDDVRICGVRHRRPALRPRSCPRPSSASRPRTRAERARRRGPGAGAGQPLHRTA